MLAKVDYGPLCNFDGCEKPPAYRFRGLCRPHYDWVNKGKKKRVLSLWATDVKPGSVHRRCKMLWGPASQHLCIECGVQANDWAYDGTDPTQLYAAASNGTWLFFSRFPEFYMPMCRKCHRVRDGGNTRMELHTYRLASFTPPRQEYGVVTTEENPEETYAQAVRTVTRSRSSRGERVIHVGRHPSSGRPRNRRRTGRTRAA